MLSGFASMSSIKVLSVKQGKTVSLFRKDQVRGSDSSHPIQWRRSKSSRIESLVAEAPLDLDKISA